MEYKEINFTEADHRYYDDNNNTYTSATQLIDKYKPKYDREFWCMYTALKENHLRVKPFPDRREIVVSGVKYKLSALLKDEIFKHYYNSVDAKWKGINAKACFRGNQTHDYLETNINKSKGDLEGITNKYIRPQGLDKRDPIEYTHQLDNTDLKDQYPDVYKRLCRYIESGCKIFAEKRVHLEEFRIAGMIDVPIIKGNRFCILDWKTNKDEIRKEAGYYKKQKIGNKWVKSNIWVYTEETMLYPINHLENSKFNLYALQLSLYAYIMEQWGYELVDRGLEIIHFRPEMSPKLIKIPYLKNEIEMILNHHKK